jgi:catechol 2,3-dioxygenase-like lactoylglutathione lyase family enzyme
MSERVDGFGHLYVETHDWERAIAFWEALGYEVEFETDHHSGKLRHPNGGPTVFVAEQSIEDPLATELYLAVPADDRPPGGVTVVEHLVPDTRCQRRRRRRLRPMASREA